MGMPQDKSAGLGMGKAFDAALAESRRLLLLRALKAAVKMLDALIDHLFRLIRMLEGGPVAESPRRRNENNTPIIPVSTVSFEYLADGSALVTINESVKLKLSPQLAAILDILAEDSGFSDDKLVAWKSFKEIRTRLCEKLGRKGLTERALQQAVYRLRNQLQPHGVSRSMLQHNPQKGYRFAVRCNGPSPLQSGLGEEN
jgi:hypothetical protein